MNPRLLRYYERELQHVREMGAEFAAEFPKIAGRLGMEGLEVADPYVERLLEGFAFLAARVQLKVDAEFPRFTQHLLSQVFPHYLSPTPSIIVSQLQPDFSETGLVGGVAAPRGTVLRSRPGASDYTVCEYRTAHDLTLWPLAIAEAEYLPTASAVGAFGVPELPGVRAGLRLRLATVGDCTLSQLPLERLPLFLRGPDAMPMLLYEQLCSSVLGVCVQPPGDARSVAARDRSRLGAETVAPCGFDDEQALLPYPPRSFQGYRLLAEYFAFPQRYLFVELRGLRSALAGRNAREADVIVSLDRSESGLESRVDAASLALFCTPAVNLFPKRADRIRITDQRPEHQIVVDRTRPVDFEVYAVDRILGYGVNNDQAQTFKAFYAAPDSERMGGEQAYYTLRREPRLLSSKQRRSGPRSSYVGSEVYVALVDGNEAPYAHELRQLSVAALCTNRDLPLHMPLGRGDTDFTLEAGLPVAAVRCVAGPSRPRSAAAEREIAWRLISHLTLNYHSLLDSGPAGAAALRELLSLYVDPQDRSGLKQIEEGVRSIDHRPVTRRLPLPGPIAFGRGLRIDLTLEESAFVGSGAFLLGAVLERFFARYAAVNTFVETALYSDSRGELMRWPPRVGVRQVL